MCFVFIKYNVSTYPHQYNTYLGKIYLYKERHRHISHAFGQIKTDTHTCTAVKFKKRLALVRIYITNFPIFF